MARVAKKLVTIVIVRDQIVIGTYLSGEGTPPIADPVKGKPKPILKDFGFKVCSCCRKTPKLLFLKSSTSKHTT